MIELNGQLTVRVDGLKFVQPATCFGHCVVVDRCEPYCLRELPTWNRLGFPCFWLGSLGLHSAPLWFASNQDQITATCYIIWKKLSMCRGWTVMVAALASRVNHSVSNLHISLPTHVIRILIIIASKSITQQYTSVSVWILFRFFNQAFMM